MKILIVGGVAGGASTAARLRRLDEHAEIVLFERGEYISYANCGLPYYIGDEIPDRDNILLQTPEAFRARFGVDVRVRNEVLAVDRGRKRVSVRDHSSGREYQESYDKLVLSPGAEALVPPIPGIRNERIFTLRNVPDADAVKAFVREHAPRRAVVVGGGYIGLEMAENLHRLGIFVTIIEMARQVIAPLDFEMAAMVHQHMKMKDVEFYLGEQVVSFSGNGKKVGVKLKSGLELDADFVILSIGVRPETKLARDAGLRIGETGGIFVDEHLRTSDPDVYALGDAIESWDPIFKLRRLIPLAGPANRQGRVVADNIVSGDTQKYSGTVATAIAKVFDMTVGVTGFPEKFLQQKKVDYCSVIIHPSSHAGYYPGATPLSLKINFAEKDGRMLGAQVIGYEGVDKLTDTFAVMCQYGMTVCELKNMDHAYAPPYSSAKSPVNMVGFVAENILTDKVKVVCWNDVRERGDDVFLLDVRTPEEFEVGRIEGAVNIPVNELRGRLDEVPKDKRIYVYCAVGMRAYIGCRILMQRGFDRVYNISGGYKTWENATMKQSNEDIFSRYRVSKTDEVLSPAAGEQGPGSGAPSPGALREIDARGMQCPGPIMRLNDGVRTAQAGDRIRITATDPGFLNDVKSWCSVTGNRLLETKQEAKAVSALIQKGGAAPAGEASRGGTDKTIVVFSDSMDRALAAFVIANGALAMGRKVTLFFTFWGLSILKKRNAPPVRKDFVSRMFGMMLPKSVHHLALSKLNMFGIGPAMMNGIMRRKNIDTLDVLVKQALDGGAKLLACQMSMDVMGISREELIDGIEVGGVASYIEAAEHANQNLFI